LSRPITKRDRDRLEVFGGQFPPPVTVMPGTCEACVWGWELHAQGCSQALEIELATIFSQFRERD